MWWHNASDVVPRGFHVSEVRAANVIRGRKIGPPVPVNPIQELSIVDAVRMLFDESKNPRRFRHLTPVRPQCLHHASQLRRAALALTVGERDRVRRSAGFQPAVSPTCSRQACGILGVFEMAERCRLQAGDTADFKSALPLPVTERNSASGVAS